MPDAALAPILGGCRAHPDGLHLGHVYGHFAGLEWVRGTAKSVFVITDCHSGRRFSLGEGVSSMAADVLAVSEIYGIDIWIVRESRLRPMMAPLVTAMIEVLTFKELVGAHPSKSAIREGVDGVTLGDVMFPIFQAALMVGLGVETAVFNDDNAAYVNLSRKLAKRVRSRLGMETGSGPKLVARTPGRLLGPDGRRVSHANGNALPIRASRGRRHRYVRELFEAYGNHGMSELRPGYDALFGSMESLDITYSSSDVDLLLEGLKRRSLCIADSAELVANHIAESEREVSRMFHGGKQASQS